MRPKEKAVLDAAIAWGKGRPGSHDRSYLGLDLESAVQELIEAREHEAAPETPEWVETAWKYVRRGDTVRMRDGGTPADVQAICVQEFGQNIESNWSEDYGSWFDNYKGAWKHLEVSVRLSLAPEKIIPFPPSAAVQVLMNAERRAIHLLTEQLGGVEIPNAGDQR